MFNQSSRVVEFILHGFSDSQEWETFHFLAFLVIYLTAVTENLLIITVIIYTPHLHKPMYFFLVNLAVQDLGSISVSVPKSMANSLMNTKTISYSGCICQVFFFLFFTVSHLFLLGIMAYDRYMAICNPLHYETVMNKKSCNKMAISVWVLGLLYSTIYTGSTFTIEFCSNDIYQFFCEMPQLVKIACSGSYSIAFCVIWVGACFGYINLALIVYSYVKIFSAVLKIPSARGKEKAFSTCLPHLIVISLYFVTSSFVYLKPTSRSTSAMDLVLSVFYCMLPPVMNPFIYCIRNKELKTGLWRLNSLQRASYGEVAKLNDDLVELAKKCSSGEQAATDCEKPLRTVFLDEICHEEGLAEKYGFTECCGKVDPERNECFLTHKNETPGFIPPFVMPDIEKVCKEYQDNRAELLANYYYELSRRHPFADISVLYKTAREYEKVLQTCCLETEKDACFREKLPAVKEQKNYAIALEKHTCSIMEEFGKRSLKFQIVAQLSQKFPKMNFPTTLKLAGDSVHFYEECCKGDTLECLLGVADVIEYFCTHQDTISAKVKDCCDRELLDQGECLIKVENDDKPADLLLTFKEFMDKEVCQNYTENKNTLLEKFVYETGRRHPEFSKQLLLRVGSKYEDLLGKCCETENPEECFNQGEGKLREHADYTLATLQMRCNLYEKAGDYGFQNELFVHYTKRAPQLTFEELYQYTKKFTSVVAKCCKEDEAHRLVCAEENTDFLLGEVCQQHKVKPLNKQMHHCCEDSYEFRRDCFSKLGVDPDYVPVPFSSELFTSHQDLCSATPDELHLRKQKQIVHLIKHQPNSTAEQLAEVTGYFTAMVTQCCEAGNHEECFTTEGPKLVERSRTVFGEQ